MNGLLAIDLSMLPHQMVTCGKKGLTDGVPELLPRQKALSGITFQRS